MIATPACGGIVGKLPAACFQFVDIADCLRGAPRAQRIGADIQQSRLGKAG